ncbi:MAG: hypothetical protein J6T10_15090 [Methanobrevibacter sp.]|nr:hypothetical protein [Methanobrevibacter sp.]
MFDFEKPEFEHELSEYERIEIRNKISDVMTEHFNDDTVKEEYNAKTGHISLEYTWYLLSGYKPTLEEVNNKMLKTLAKYKTDYFDFTTEIKNEILKACKFRDKDKVNAAAYTAFVMAEQDIIADKDLQKKILEQKTDIEDFYAKMGLNGYMTYSINMEMITRWSNEKYTDTIFKKKVYDEIELIEKEPLPEKK